MGEGLAGWGNLSLASRLLGTGPITPAGWLLRDDIAMNRIRAEGLPGFSALASSFRLRLAHCGYGRGALYWGHLRRGSTLPARGFCLLMIFAYASIVFLAVLRRRLSFYQGLYPPLVLLHGSLRVRLAGNLVGGILSAVPILGFFAAQAGRFVIGEPR